MKCLAWTPLLLLLACEMGRPYGSFEPRRSDGARDAGSDDEGGDDDDDDDDDGDKGETGILIDAGSGDGPEKPPPDSPLAAYAGTYLMRMDMYSNLSLPVASTKIEVKNRLSNLILTEIGVEDGELVGRETYCHQTYAHNCTEGCVDGWTTTPDDGLTRFFPHATAPRRYRIDGDKLVGEESIVALGFDEEGANKSTEVPADVNDERLWKPKANAFGVVTRVQTKVRVAGTTQALDCEVSTVQLMSTTFEGALGAEEAPLEEARFPLQPTALAALPLAASGTPSVFCNTKAINNQDAQEGPPGESYVRFRKTDIVGECPPVQEFEAQLPADPP